MCKGNMFTNGVNFTRGCKWNATVPWAWTASISIRTIRTNHLTLLSDVKLAFSNQSLANYWIFVWFSLYYNQVISFGPTHAVSRKQSRKWSTGCTSKTVFFHVVDLQSRDISLMLLLQGLLLTTLKLDCQEKTEISSWATV